MNETDNSLAAGLEKERRQRQRGKSEHTRSKEQQKEKVVLNDIKTGAYVIGGDADIQGEWSTEEVK